MLQNGIIFSILLEPVLLPLIIFCKYFFTTCFCNFHLSKFNFIFLLFRLFLLSQFFPLCPSPSSPSHPTTNAHTVVRVHGWCIYVLCLIPSPSFIHSQPPTSPLNNCHSVPRFCACDSIFCNFHLSGLLGIPANQYIIIYLKKTYWKT